MVDKHPSEIIKYQDWGKQGFIHAYTVKTKDQDIDGEHSTLIGEFWKEYNQFGLVKAKGRAITY